jgi:hypothetical protein
MGRFYLSHGERHFGTESKISVAAIKGITLRLFAHIFSLQPQAKISSQT